MITVCIIQADIDDGVRWSPRQCPVAKAAIRALGSDDISVGPTTLTLNMSTPSRSLVLFPTIAVEFIRLFDAKEPVQPITFELPI